MIPVFLLICPFFFLAIFIFSPATTTCKSSPQAKKSSTFKWPPCVRDPITLLYAKTFEKSINLKWLKAFLVGLGLSAPPLSITFEGDPPLQPNPPFLGSGHGSLNRFQIETKAGEKSASINHGSSKKLDREGVTRQGSLKG